MNNLAQEKIYPSFDLLSIQIDRGISDTQGKVFEKACLDGWDLAKFTDLYMKSHFCRKSMDYKASRYAFEDADTCLEEIYKEIGYPMENARSDENVGYWIGYTYRQICCETGHNSSDIIDIIPFNKLVRNYAAHHCLDEDMSGEMLCSYFHLQRIPEYQAYSIYLNSGEF